MQLLFQNHRRSNHRNGLTLVELLVVIAIISIVSAATIPLFTPPVDEQKTREAARLFATTIEAARSLAVETGRPAGIWLQPLTGNTLAVSDLFSCETPEPYSGDDTSSFVTLSWSGTTSIQLNFTGAGSINTLCHYGDLIRFNNSGEYYQIWDTATALSVGSFGNPINPSNAFLGPTGLQTRPGFMPNQPTNPPYGVPFQIIRAPVKSAGTPVSLPISAPAALIDLASSGIGSSGVDFNSNGVSPILITFEPSGQVSKVQYFNGSAATPQLESINPASTIYFLVRLNKDGDNAITAPALGYTDQTATWVSINPFTGLVSVADNLPGTGGSLATAREASQKAIQKGGL